MKYRLLKDLPHSKAWEYKIHAQNEDITILETEFAGKVYYSKIPTYYIDNKEWFEEIKEVKSLYELKEWDTYYSIADNWYIETYYIWDEQDLYEVNQELYLYFATKEEVETELQKRKDIAWYKKYCFDNPDDKQAQSVLNLLKHKEIEVIDYFNRIH